MRTSDKENFDDNLKISNRALRKKSVPKFDKIILGVLAVMLVGTSSVFIGALSAIGEEGAGEAALRVVPGDVEEIEFENGVYEVDVRTNRGEREVSVSQTGEIIGIEDEEEDVPITGNALERASKAALDYIGEGRVTDSEIGDEEGHYEIEVTLDSGKEADVHLDREYKVLSVEFD